MALFNCEFVSSRNTTFQIECNRYVQHCMHVQRNDAASSQLNRTINLQNFSSTLSSSNMVTRNAINGSSPSEDHAIKRLITGATVREKEIIQESPWAFEGEALDDLISMTNLQGANNNNKNENGEGLGITQFLENKQILITGATGFLGKVLVEKILRVQPNVGKLYLLINADTAPKATERLTKEIQDSKLFECLKNKYGPRFDKFIEDKLIAVGGKIEKPNLGIDGATAKDLIDEVDIVINSAATTNFFERYDVALDINTKGPLHLLQFAKQCTNLQLFLHVSTAYVNGTRKGRVHEVPFSMGHSIAKEMSGDDSTKISDLDVWAEIASVNIHNKFSSEDMKQLGMERAALHGWQDTYVFTKAMGEMLINEARGEIPVVIVRPSVVEATAAQPFKGWIQGTRMMDPIIIAAGRGQLGAFYADPNGVLDVVPADMVANVILASLCKNAGKGPKLNIYQIGSSAINPLKFNELARNSVSHFKSNPFLDQKGQPINDVRCTLHTTKIGFLIHNFLLTGLPMLLSKFWSNENIRRQIKKTSFVAERVDQLICTYSPYTFYKGRFDISNTINLYKQMSDEEKEEYGFAIWSICWENYIKNIHLPGLRKYSLRDSNRTFRPITTSEYIQALFNQLSS